MMPDTKPAPGAAPASPPGAPGAPKAGPAKAKPVVEAYSFRRHGVPHVRRAATIFGMVFLLSAALVTAAHLVLAKTRPNTDAARQNQSAARERLAQAEAERIEIRDFQPKFEQLRARGFFGAENRLVLLEAIGAIQRARKLLPITYEVAPQQVVALDPLLLGAPLELHASTLTVRLGLLHEMDLVHFMQDLKASGFFTVHQCQLNALEVPPGSAIGPRVNADCTLYWLTVGEAAPVAPEAAAGG